MVLSIMSCGLLKEMCYYFSKQIKTYFCLVDGPFLVVWGQLKHTFYTLAWWLQLLHGQAQPKSFKVLVVKVSTFLCRYRLCLSLYELLPAEPCQWTGSSTGCPRCPACSLNMAAGMHAYRSGACTHATQERWHRGEIFKPPLFFKTYFNLSARH